MTEQSDLEQRKSAVLTAEQMRAAIPQIKALIAELQEIDVSKTKERGEERFELLEEKIDSTLAAIFGKDTVEYERFRVESLDTAKIHMMYEISLYEVKEGYVRGIEQAVSNLRAVIEWFGEKVLVSGDSLEAGSGRSCAERGLHPVIEQAVAEAFKSGMYAEAVDFGCKALENEVTRKCGNDTLKGKELMEYAFDLSDTVLRCNELKTEAECEEQRGMVSLFAGAMMIGGNPEAVSQICADPEKTLEFISLLSFLTKSLDGAKKAPSRKQ